MGRLAWLCRPGAFRLFLALIVFAHHCSRIGLGRLPVYVFFVLSGYWIHRMWVARYAFARAPLVTYLISRLWRLAPVMVLTSAITIVLLAALGTPWPTILAAGPLHLILSSVFLLGYTNLTYRPLGPAWSLDMEAQFYLLAPLLSLALRPMGRTATLLAAVAVTLLSSDTALIFYGSVTLASFLGFFACGMAAAHLGWRPSGKLAWLSGGGTLAVTLALFASPWSGLMTGGAHPGPLYAWNPFINILLAIAMIPLAIFTTRQPSGPTDRMFADLSFIVYLQHWIAAVWLYTLTGSALVRLPAVAFALAAVLAASWLIWRWYDRPINAARSRWVAARVAGGPARVADEVTGP